jgi:hypothetical protein
MKTKAPPALTPTRETVSFGVRLDADLIDRLDAYAAAHQHKRGWALARAVETGLDALGVSGGGDGVTARPPEAIPGRFGADEVALVADAVAERLRPQLGMMLVEARRSAGTGDRHEQEHRVAEAIRFLQNAKQPALTGPPDIGRQVLATAIEVAVIILAGSAAPSASRSSGWAPPRDSSGRTLGARLQAARAALKLTPSAVARAAKVSRNDYYDAAGDEKIGEEATQRLLAWLASLPSDNSVIQGGLGVQGARPGKSS